MTDVEVAKVEAAAKRVLDLAPTVGNAVAQRWAGIALRLIARIREGAPAKQINEH